MIVNLLMVTVCSMAQDFPQRPTDQRGDGTNFPFPDIGTDTTANEIDSTGQIIYQNTDTINFRKVVRVYSMDLIKSAPEFSLDEIHHYQPVEQTDEPAIYLGVNGRPAYNYTFDLPYESEVNSGIDAYSIYAIADDDVRYYRAERPYTHLKYVTGSKRENMFMAEHTQNWGRGLNVGFQYSRLVTDGLYQNQIVDHNNVAIHAWYQSKNKHWNTMAHFISNKYIVGEMGGIVDTIDYFSDNDYDQRTTIPVLLKSAESRLKSRNFTLQNSFDFGRKVALKINDTLTDNEIIPKFRLQHTAQYINDFWRYTSANADTLFYSNFFIDAVDFLTNDSLTIKRLSNEFRMKWLGNKAGENDSLIRQNFLADAFLRFSTYEVEDNGGITDDFTNVTIGGNFRSNPLDTPKFNYKAAGAYHLSGFKQNDYHIRGELGYDVAGKVGRITAFVDWLNQESPYTAQKLNSNHFQFNNNFDKTNARTIGGTYENEIVGFNAGLRFANVSNLIYYDEQSLPRQESDALSYVLVHAGKTFHFGKFNARIRAWYQKASNETALGITDLLADATLFYKGPLFKNKVFTKIGIDTYFTNSYNFDEYTPALGQFHAQDVNYDSWPVVNFFSNFQFSRARLFLRLDHLDSFLISDKVLYSAHRIPYHDFAFRTGISWVFVN